MNEETEISIVNDKTTEELLQARQLADYECYLFLVNELRYMRIHKALYNKAETLIHNRQLANDRLISYIASLNK